MNNDNPICERHENIAKKTIDPAIAKSNDLWASEGLLLPGDNVAHGRVSKICVEIRHVVVDSLENGVVWLFLRPNASLACRAYPTVSKRSLYVHLQPNSGFRILRDQVDDSLM